MELDSRAALHRLDLTHALPDPRVRLFGSHALEQLGDLSPLARSPAGTIAVSDTSSSASRLGTTRCSRANASASICVQRSSSRSWMSRVSQPQTSNAFGQRGWKLQPCGGVTASGTSPRGRSRGIAFAGSGSGMARSSDWVYGCRGFA